MEKRSIILGVLLFAIIIAGIMGCASLKTFFNTSDTSLTSNSLATISSLRAQGITTVGTNEGGDWLITPTKISGKVLSVVLPVNGKEDEGVVPFGAGRPDIAPAQSDLYDFDLSQVTKLHKDTMGMKPGFAGGTCEAVIMLFGYFDVEFEQGSTTKKIRFIYGDTTPYLRGDKLLYNAGGVTTNKYYWYSSTEGFVSESASRPSNAVYNYYVKTFSDPVRPDMHYYMLGAKLTANTDYDGTKKEFITLSRRIVEDNNLTFTVDFDVQNAVKFIGISSEAAFNALTEAQLIDKFDMKQNTSEWGNSGLFCSITFEVKAKY